MLMHREDSSSASAGGVGGVRGGWVLGWGGQVFYFVGHSVRAAEGGGDGPAFPSQIFLLTSTWSRFLGSHRSRTALVSGTRGIYRKFSLSSF